MQTVTCSVGTVHQHWTHGPSQWQLHTASLALVVFKSIQSFIDVVLLSLSPKVPHTNQTVCSVGMSPLEGLSALSGRGGPAVAEDRKRCCLLPVSRLLVRPYRERVGRNQSESFWSL